MPLHPAPATPPDPRTHAYRPDLADAALEGLISATDYRPGAPGHVTAHRTAIRDAPDDDARQTSEALYGEPLSIFDSRDGWAWVQMRGDRYVGYVRAADAEAGVAPPATHRVTAPRALLFAGPDLKSPIRGWLPFLADVHADRWEGDYGRLPDGRWTHRRWLAEAGEAPSADPVETARRFLGVPYGWGGKTVAGLDCSGLVQIALRAAGMGCPRDSDQQADAVGTPLDAGAPARRGDIVFFPGHVGLMADAETLIHANATSMAVTMDPLEEVEARIRQADKDRRGITARRRLGQ